MADESEHERIGGFGFMRDLTERALDLRFRGLRSKQSRNFDVGAARANQFVDLLRLRGESLLVFGLAA